MKNKNLIKSVIIIFVLIIVVSFVEFAKPKDETILNFEQQVSVNERDMIEKFLRDNDLLFSRPGLTFSVHLEDHFSGSFPGYILPKDMNVMSATFIPFYKNLPVSYYSGSNYCFFDLDSMSSLDKYFPECMYFFRGLRDGFSYTGDLTPVVTKRQAFELGKKLIMDADVPVYFYDKDSNTWPDLDVDLMIAPVDASKYGLVWRVAPTSVELGYIPEFLIDAKTGYLALEHVRDN